MSQFSSRFNGRRDHDVLPTDAIGIGLVVDEQGSCMARVRDEVADPVKRWETTSAGSSAHPWRPGADETKRNAVRLDDESASHFCDFKIGPRPQPCGIEFP